MSTYKKIRRETVEPSIWCCSNKSKPTADVSNFTENRIGRCTEIRSTATNHVHCPRPRVAPGHQCYKYEEIFLFRKKASSTILTGYDCTHLDLLKPHFSRGYIGKNL